MVSKPKKSILNHGIIELNYKDPLIKLRNALKNI